MLSSMFQTKTALFASRFCMKPAMTNTATNRHLNAGFPSIPSKPSCLASSPCCVSDLFSLPQLPLAERQLGRDNNNPTARYNINYYQLQQQILLQSITSTTTRTTTTNNTYYFQQLLPTAIASYQQQPLPSIW